MAESKPRSRASVAQHAKRKSVSVWHPTLVDSMIQIRGEGSRNDRNDVRIFLYFEVSLLVLLQGSCVLARRFNSYVFQGSCCPARYGDFGRCIGSQQEGCWSCTRILFGRLYGCSNWKVQWCNRFGATCVFFTLVFCPESLFGLKPKNQWQAFKLHLTGQVQISFGLGLSLYCGIASLFGYLQYGTSNWNPSNFSWLAQSGGKQEIWRPFCDFCAFGRKHRYFAWDFWTKNTHIHTYSGLGLYQDTHLCHIWIHPISFWIFIQAFFLKIFILSPMCQKDLPVTCRNGERSMRRPIPSMPWNALSSFDLANSIAVKPMAHAWEIYPAVPWWNEDSCRTVFPWKIFISLVLHVEVNAYHMILLLVARTIRQLWAVLQCWDWFCRFTRAKPQNPSKLNHQPNFFFKA